MLRTVMLLLVLVVGLGASSGCRAFGPQYDSFTLTTKLGQSGFGRVMRAASRVPVVGIVAAPPVAACLLLDLLALPFTLPKDIATLSNRGDRSGRRLEEGRPAAPPSRVARRYAPARRYRSVSSEQSRSPAYVRPPPPIIRNPAAGR